MYKEFKCVLPWCNMIIQTCVGLCNMIIINLCCLRFNNELINVQHDNEQKYICPIKFDQVFDWGKNDIAST